jgi:5-methylcytosine-specific restriction endonuclease McrA
MKRRFSKRQKMILALRAGGSCERCGSHLDGGFHADHVRAFSQGGETTLNNGQALCPACNLKKGFR